MKSVFLISIFLIIYTYLLYPAALFILSLFRKKPALAAQEGELFSVSLIISAYNEEAVMKEKIRNCLALDYPAEKIEVIFGSDGSLDKTSEIIERYAKENRMFRLYKFDKRQGKPSVLNRLVNEAKGDIIVFSDADTFLDPASIRNIVKGFADPKVGCVCGKIELMSKGKEIVSESFYWRYESWIKGLEARLGFVSGAAGGLYAIRRNLWQDIPRNTLIDDFVISMRIGRDGYAVISEPLALGREETALSSYGEFLRRVRIGAGGYQSILLLAGLLNPLKGLKSFEFWSHKVIRWLAPFLFIGLFLTSVLLCAGGGFYAAIFILQAVFYSAAVLGWLLQKVGVNVIVFNAAYHFVLMNIALAVGFFSFIFGLQKVTWRKAEKFTRRDP